MVTSGFYDSLNHDRRYSSIQFGSIFDGVIQDGVFQHVGSRLMVSQNSGMMISVGTGRAWFNHTWTYNDSILPLTVPQSEVILDRVDAVVLEVDAREEGRINAIKIVKGTPTSKNAKPPAMLKEKNRWQYPLAYIKVAAGVTSIRTADITNKVGTSDCPFVTAPLDKMSIDDLVKQWADQWRVFYENETADMNKTNAFWKEQWRIWYAGQTAEIQQTYLNWEKQWEDFYNTHSGEIERTAEEWKEQWQLWFYEYVNNSTRELAYWKTLVTDDFTEYSTFWKNEWRKWYDSQTAEIQQTYLNWEKQWEDFYNTHSGEIERTAEEWKVLWQTWFEEYVNTNQTDYNAWKDNLNTDFMNWWDSIREVLDSVDVSAFAAKLADLEKRIDELEIFKSDLATDHSIYDYASEENGDVLDNGQNKIKTKIVEFATVEGQEKFETDYTEFKENLRDKHSIFELVTDSDNQNLQDSEERDVQSKVVEFVAVKDVDLYKEVASLSEQVKALQETILNLVLDHAFYQTISDGGSWLLSEYEQVETITKRTEDLLDSFGESITGVARLAM
ncbi:hypothetical protein AALB64_13850 [Lachnospiraceae bacterium 45-P1]|jgi:hypothetical protein